MASRLAQLGIRRVMRYRGKKSSAWCGTCSKYLASGVSHRTAQDAAVTHVEETGHETLATHVQTVRYWQG